ncbi:hypothetical protein OAH08_04845 [Verrucomicrobia bacterium]|nr:hypothetical protein [Verrucomicrobiota bacterium]
MQKKFSDGLAPVDAAPQLIKDDLSEAAGAVLKPHLAQTYVGLFKQP